MTSYLDCVAGGKHGELSLPRHIVVVVHQHAVPEGKGFFVNFFNVTGFFKFFSLYVLYSTRVSDPHWFNADPDTDPDPAFFLIDPDPGFDDLKFKKNLQLEI